MVQLIRSAMGREMAPHLGCLSRLRPHTMHFVVPSERLNALLSHKRYRRPAQQTRCTILAQPCSLHSETLTWYQEGNSLLYS